MRVLNFGSKSGPTYRRFSEGELLRKQMPLWVNAPVEGSIALNYQLRL